LELNYLFRQVACPSQTAVEIEGQNRTRNREVPNARESMVHNGKDSRGRGLMSAQDRWFWAKFGWEASYLLLGATIKDPGLPYNRTPCRQDGQELFSANLKRRVPSGLPTLLIQRVLGLACRLLLQGWLCRICFVILPSGPLWSQLWKSALLISDTIAKHQVILMIQQRTRKIWTTTHGENAAQFIKQWDLYDNSNYMDWCNKQILQVRSSGTITLSIVSTYVVHPKPKPIV